MLRQNFSTLEQYGMATPDNPIELVVHTPADRAQLGIASCRVRTTRLPGNSYLRLLPTRYGGSGLPPSEQCRLFVESVPLVIASQAGMLADLVRAGRLDRKVAILKLAALACEFCGTYSRDASNPQDGELLYDRPAIATATDIQVYLRSLCHSKGVELARTASRLARDGLASPMELLVYAALGFPPRFGGIHVGDLKINEPLALDEELQKKLGIHRITPDIRVGGHPVALEYNGVEHLEKYRVRQDKMRSQMYALLDVAHFPMMIEDVCTPAALDRTLRSIVDLLTPYEGPAFRKRVQQIMRDETYIQARAMLLGVYLPGGVLVAGNGP